MAVIDAFHLPPTLTQRPLLRIAERDGLALMAPELEPDDLDGICDSLLAARERLAELPVARVIAAIDAAARRLRTPGDPARSAVLQSLTAITGYSAEMAELVVDRMSDDWLAPALGALLDAEFGGVAALEGFVPRAGVRTRAVGVPLGLHVFSGNVPGVSVTSIVRALLVRSAVLGKTASGEPALAPAFARLLAEVDPAVGDCVAVTWWQGGNERLEDAALRRAGMVVYYGGAEGAASLRARMPATARFVEHGPRVSCVVAELSSDGKDRSAVRVAAARDTARAVALFDQQGCVSPQFACVIGQESEARSFAEAVAEQLDRLAPTLPRGRLEPGEAAWVHALRAGAEFRGLAGQNVALWTGSDLTWTVVCDPGGDLTGSCLNRTLLVHSAASLEHLLARLQPLGAYLQTVGVAGFHNHDLPRVATALAGIGATRVSTIAAMPWPPASWHHDGSGPLRELVRWVDLEA